jgi:class 3 adenylate cyclase
MVLFRVVRTRNLAIVFAGICGYAERLGLQTWEQSQRMLRVQEALLDPVFRAYGGKRIKQIGGTFLYSFASPTEAVLCAAALLERVGRYDERVPEADRLQVRAGIHLGDVRLERGDVFGEPVNIAARIEAMAGPGEVLFGESVWLSMNRAEVSAEDAGERALKGVPEPVRLFRLLGALRPLLPLPPPDQIEHIEPPSEISTHLNAAFQAALRKAEDAWPARARLFVGAGLAAMLAVAAAFFALARLGALP